MLLNFLFTEFSTEENTTLLGGSHELGKRHPHNVV
jgi:hypothetical protein